MISDEQIEEFQCDGVTCLGGVFADWIDLMPDSAERKTTPPRPHALQNVAAAGRSMRPRRTQLIHGHVIIRPGRPSKDHPGIQA
ncbi:MAG: hypothetical protein ACC631_00265 [Halocynthiibacter sp.]